MTIDFNTIKKFLFLGIAVVSTKLMLLLFAYFFDADTYNQFNQIYYTASLLILFGSLGFNIALTRIKINLFTILSIVAANSIVAAIFLEIFSDPFDTYWTIISVIIYSVLISVTGIYTFQLLFTSRYKEYVFLTIAYSLLHLMIIPAIIYLSLSISLMLPVVSFCWLLIALPKILEENRNYSKDLKEFYKIGVSAFVINSAVSLALAADKYFANHFFTMEIANSYTFSWSLTAPIFYIGVIIEQFLFSEQNTTKSNILKRGFVFSSVLVICYSIIVLLIINFFPGVIPRSVDYNNVINIATMMFTGYSIYVIIHFPVNAYLFKSMSTGIQKSVSITFSVIIIVFLFFYIAVMQELIKINYAGLLIITWSYIFTLLISKLTLMFRNKNEVQTLPSNLEIKNLEP